MANKTPAFERFFLGLPAEAQKNPATNALRNSGRLFTDAKKIAKHGSYQTAIALHILALEELAKFVSLAFDRPLDVNISNPHVRKHKELASFFIQQCYKLCIMEFFGVEFHIKDGKFVLDLDENSDQYKKIAMMFKASEYVKEERDSEFPYIEEWSEIIEMESMNKALRFFVLYYDNRLNEIKNKCLYLDYNDGKVVSSPYDIDREMLKTVKELSDTILETVRKVIG